MEIEQLTKSQLLLLALLVSFVTSIATGIVTVTLVNQAPTDVIRTINREVQTIVEKVTPGETKIIERIKENGPTEGDLVVLAVKKNKDAILLVKIDELTYHPAVSISALGDILTQSEGLVKGEVYNLIWSVNTSTSTKLSAKVEDIDDVTGVALLKLVPVGGSSGLPFIALGGSAPALGERVFALGQTKDFGETVRLGNVTTIKTDNASSTPIIVTSITGASSVIDMPVLDLSGDLIGLYIGTFAGFDGVTIPGSYFSARFKALISEKQSDTGNTASAANAAQ